MGGGEDPGMGTGGDPGMGTGGGSGGSSPIRVDVGGNRWWNGFTAELTVTNTSGAPLTSWSTTFDTPHRISGDPWGVSVQATDLGGGMTRYTLSGKDWAAALPVGGSVTVGFNGTQGTPIGNSGSLAAAQLYMAGSGTGTGTGSGAGTGTGAGSGTGTGTGTGSCRFRFRFRCGPHTGGGTDPSPGTGTGTGTAPDYAGALGLSFLFYEANRSETSMRPPTGCPGAGIRVCATAATASGSGIGGRRTCSRG